MDRFCEHMSVDMLNCFNADDTLEKLGIVLRALAPRITSCKFFNWKNGTKKSAFARESPIHLRTPKFGILSGVISLTDPEPSNWTEKNSSLSSNGKFVTLFRSHETTSKLSYTLTIIRQQLITEKIAIWWTYSSLYCNIYHVGTVSQDGRIEITQRKSFHTEQLQFTMTILWSHWIWMKIKSNTLSFITEIVHLQS